LDLTMGLLTGGEVPNWHGSSLQGLMNIVQPPMRHQLSRWVRHARCHAGLHSSVFRIGLPMVAGVLLFCVDNADPRSAIMRLMRRRYCSRADRPTIVLDGCPFGVGHHPISSRFDAACYANPLGAACECESTNVDGSQTCGGLGNRTGDNEHARLRASPASPPPTEVAPVL